MHVPRYLPGCLPPSAGLIRRGGAPSSLVECETRFLPHSLGGLFDSEHSTVACVCGERIDYLLGSITCPACVDRTRRFRVLRGFTRRDASWDGMLPISRPSSIDRQDTDASALDGRWACVVDLHVASISVVDDDDDDDVATLWGRNRLALTPTNAIFRLLRLPVVVVDIDWMSAAEAA